MGLADSMTAAEIDTETIIDDRVYHTITEVKNGLGPSPLKTPKGWLQLAHGVRNTAAGLRYVLYLFLTDLHEPHRVMRIPGVFHGAGGRRAHRGCLQCALQLRMGGEEERNGVHLLCFIGYARPCGHEHRGSPPGLRSAHAGGSSAERRRSAPAMCAYRPELKTRKRTLPEHEHRFRVVPEDADRRGVRHEYRVSALGLLRRVADQGSPGCHMPSGCCATPSPPQAQKFEPAKGAPARAESSSTEQIKR